MSSFHQVFDRSGRRIRGLWERNGAFYVQAMVENPETGIKKNNRLRLDGVTDVKTEQVATITATAFLQDGQLFIDCVPPLRRKYVTPVPDDAIISSSDRPDKPWRFGIIIRSERDAGKFIQRLFDAKTISNN